MNEENLSPTPKQLRSARRWADYISRAPGGNAAMLPPERWGIVAAVYRADKPTVEGWVERLKAAESNLRRLRREVEATAGLRAVTPDRRCEQCDGPLALSASPSARFCSSNCRVAHHRAHVLAETLSETKLEAARSALRAERERVVPEAGS